MHARHPRWTPGLLLALATALGGAARADMVTPPAKPNKQMAEVLGQLAALNPKPIETLSPEEARLQPTPADAVKALLQQKKKSTAPLSIGPVTDVQIDGAEGKLTARIFTPKGKGPFPVLLYFHGGGFVIATNDTYDASGRALADGAGCVVVSPEYRKAPESRFPAAHDDAIAAYKWVLANAASFQGDPGRVAVAGESAGGNLAINVAIAARDQRLPMPLHQVLVYPVAGSNVNTTSYQAYAAAKPLNKPMMGWFFEKALSSPKDASDPRLDLVHASLTGLPATTIITAQIDPLHDDGVALAAALKAAGVAVTSKDYEGVTHEFFGMGAVVDEAKKAEGVASAALKKAFKDAQKAQKR